MVQFIDYGNQSTVATGNLKNLPQSMLNKPAASVKCHLRDLQVKPGSEQKVCGIETLVILAICRLILGWRLR